MKWIFIIFLLNFLLNFVILQNKTYNDKFNITNANEKDLENFLKFFSKAKKIVIKLTPEDLEDSEIFEDLDEQLDDSEGDLNLEDEDLSNILDDLNSIIGDVIGTQKKENKDKFPFFDDYEDDKEKIEDYRWIKFW